MTETDFQNTPHFSRGGAAYAAVGTVWILIDLALPVSVLVLGVVAVAPLIERNLTWIPPVGVFATICMGSLFVGYRSVRHAARMIRRSNDISSLPFAPDENHRVRVICWPDEVERLQAIARAPFEPERFRAYLPDSRFLDLTKPGRQLGALAGLPIWILHTLVISATRPYLRWFALAEIVVLAAALAVLCRLPTFVRFSPGKLELIRYKFFGTTVRDAQTFSLSGPVTISTRGLGRISWTDADGKARILPLALVMGGRSRVDAVLAAAINHYETPEPESL